MEQWDIDNSCNVSEKQVPFKNNYQNLGTSNINLISRKLCNYIEKRSIIFAIKVFSNNMEAGILPMNKENNRTAETETSLSKKIKLRH